MCVREMKRTLLFPFGIQVKWMGCLKPVDGNGKVLGKVEKVVESAWGDEAYAARL